MILSHSVHIKKHNAKNNKKTKANGHHQRRVQLPQRRTQFRLYTNRPLHKFSLPQQQAIRSE